MWLTLYIVGARRKLWNKPKTSQCIKGTFYNTKDRKIFQLKNVLLIRQLPIVC